MRGETILLVDDEQLIRWSLRQALSKQGFGILEAESMAKAVEQLDAQNVDLIVLDQKLPDGTGIEVLRKIQSGGGTMPVIMLTAVDRSETAVQAMKLGAFDYVTKPVNHEELILVIEKALEATRLKRQVAHFLKEQEREHGFCGMIGNSPVMKKIYSDIAKIAQSSGTTVLITGESGTGKELVAKAIHFLSERKDDPLIIVNMSTLTENLVESELFGHEKGAFTDATAQKKGIFEIADKGTIFLDEIGDVAPRIQVKLLRTIEQKVFQRVGGTRDISVDVRVIAATNRPLERLVAKGLFREDLYYRLNVVSVHTPPIRERTEDIPLLAEYFLQEFNVKFHKNFQQLSDATMERFLKYPWPGNVREIRNVLERALLLNDGDVVQPHHVEFQRLNHTPANAFHVDAGDEDADLSLIELEKKTLLQALEKSQYNQSRAAKLLKISRDTLRYRMKKYDLLGKGNTNSDKPPA